MLTILAEAALRSLLLGSVVWLGLNLLRVRNPNAHKTAWVLVLMASLSMPLLMHWSTVTVTVHALPAPAPERLIPAEPLLPKSRRAAPPLEQRIAEASPNHSYIANADWWEIATVIYWLIAALLLARLVLGFQLTWRLARAATPIREHWVADRDVRVSSAINGPVTFGSTILVPPAFANWDSTKRLAVLAHESAHIANRDFYVLLLASLNRVLFWFSPFAWWQLARLAELAEIISDDRAIEILADRVSYAEVLLDLVQARREGLPGWKWQGSALS